MNTNLQIGQRIDVWEVLPGNTYATICEDHLQVGSQMVAITERIGNGGVWLNSKYGECYHYPIDCEVKKVGTLIIKTIK
jgi:hypothetical protein